jgi:hypothetical protein
MLGRRVLDAAAGAEQDAVVRQQPVVKQQAARIPDLLIGPPADRLALGLAQRPSDNDVGKHGQQPAVGPGMQPVAGVAVGGDHHLPGAHRAAGRAQEMTPAVASPLDHGRGVVDDGALR